MELHGGLWWVDADRASPRTALRMRGPYAVLLLVSSLEQPETVGRKRIAPRMGTGQSGSGTHDCDTGPVKRGYLLKSR